MEEMEEMLLDIEAPLNNWPQTYVDDDIEKPILTTNVLILGQIINSPDLGIEQHNPDITKEQCRINKNKKAAWQRQDSDYMKRLRERHNTKCKIM